MDKDGMENKISHWLNSLSVYQHNTLGSVCIAKLKKESIQLQAENEQLQAELESAKDCIKKRIASDGHWAENKRLKAEIEQLKLDISKLQVENKELEAELTRLKTIINNRAEDQEILRELELFKDENELLKESVEFLEKYDSDVDGLQAKNEKLKNLLEEIQQSDRIDLRDHYYKAIEQALKGGE